MPKTKQEMFFLGSGEDITEWLFVRGVEVVDYTIYIFFETIIRSLHTFFLFMNIIVFPMNPHKTNIIINQGIRKLITLNHQPTYGLFALNI